MHCNISYVMWSFIHYIMNPCVSDLPIIQLKCCQVIDSKWPISLLILINNRDSRQVARKALI